LGLGRKIGSHRNLQNRRVLTVDKLRRQQLRPDISDCPTGITDHPDVLTKMSHLWVKNYAKS
jgi:hypothetical protein